MERFVPRNHKYSVYSTMKIPHMRYDSTSYEAQYSPVGRAGSIVINYILSLKKKVPTMVKF